MTINEQFNGIEQIAATIAHEVKNPISLVQANIDLLELVDKNSSHKKNYLIMRKELKKITELMMDFTNFLVSSSEEWDVIYLDEIISDILESFCASLCQNIEFSYKCLNKEAAVLGNKKSISIVLSNIIKNSVEAITSDGKIIIDVKEDDSKVLIIVTDNGVGLTDSDEKNMFNNLYTTKKTGNGLGLPICKKIIQEHKGSLKLANGPEGGCISTIILPGLHC